MNITLKNKHIDLIFKLLNVPLHGQERIDRDHFSRYLITKADETESYRMNLLNELAEKDEKNKPKMKPDNNFDLTPENEEKFKNELMMYLDSDMIIDILDSNKKELNTVKNILINTKQSLTFYESSMLDDILNAFNKKEEKVVEEIKKEIVEEKTEEVKNEVEETTEENNKDVKE